MKRSEVTDRHEATGTGAGTCPKGHALHHASDGRRWCQVCMEYVQPTLAIGTRVYNHGDMANAPHFGTLTSVRSDRWGTHYVIRQDSGESYIISPAQVSPEFMGHSGTRIVTEEAYKSFRAARIAQLKAAVHGAA